jgi:hypothetical protein
MSEGLSGDSMAMEAEHHRLTIGRAFAATAFSRLSNGRRI